MFECTTIKSLHGNIFINWMDNSEKNICREDKNNQFCKLCLLSGCKLIDWYIFHLSSGVEARLIKESRLLLEYYITHLL